MFPWSRIFIPFPFHRKKRYEEHSDKTAGLLPLRKSGDIRSNRRVHSILQFTDGKADGGLGQMQFFGGFRNTFALIYGDENTDVAKCHNPVLSRLKYVHNELSSII